MELQVNPTAWMQTPTSEMVTAPRTWIAKLWPMRHGNSVPACMARSAILYLVEKARELDEVHGGTWLDDAPDDDGFLDDRGTHAEQARAEAEAERYYFDRVPGGELHNEVRFGPSFDPADDQLEEWYA